MDATVLGVKHGTFTDQGGRSIPYNQIALDMGNYLKVFKVKPAQAHYLDDLVTGQRLTEEDGFTVDKFFIFS